MKSAAMILCIHLVSTSSFTETKTTHYNALALIKSVQIMRRWSSGLIENDQYIDDTSVVVCCEAIKK